MTSKFTREQLIEKLKHRIAITEKYPHLEEAQIDSQIFKIALAAMDSEPVAEIRAYYPLGIDGGKQKFVQVTGELPDFGAQLYAIPQPAPVVTFYRDGIEAAAKWIDQQREAYVREHGWSDPDTGAFEFGNDAQRGYSSTLEELAEGIRALHPNAGNSPIIPEGLIAAVNRLLDSDGSRGCYSAIRCGNARFEVERLLAAAPQEVPDGK
ncbi:hypothetical protein [Klebsiella michiganensis]|uniref:hypothetical protein n=1 Tax=Klebsiella michiganensis TaxID=1134687 RepID=UPI002174DBA1|nr:hypothetical protein [Klebsiella michiganensis]MCZ0063369.1 hypothetical protein [Klebsiella michiganensis]MCZ0079370.1 hypothetical protein [Klebsiella michiganensis]WAX83081.1 hypothetical protein F0A14_018795 [Klebsiella michiganensis]